MRWERAPWEEDPQTWTTIDNLVIDDDLSCRALGLLIRWLRRPPGVEIDSIPEMVKWARRKGKQNLEGRDALYSASHELERAGFLVRKLITHTDGTHEWVVRIYSKPVPLGKRSDPDERSRIPQTPPKPRSRKKPQVAPVTGNPYPAEPNSGEPEVSLKESRKGLSSSSSYSSADAPVQDPERLPLRGEEDDEDGSPPPAGRPAAERHPGTDTVIKKISWPKGKKPRGHGLHQLREAVSCALTRGWGADDLAEAVCADVDWDRVRFPASVVLSVVQKHAQHASSSRTADEEAILSLEREIGAQRAAVASCEGCDDRGRSAGRWHGHGRQGLDTELWELKNPEQAATNRALNGQNFRVA